MVSRIPAFVQFSVVVIYTMVHKKCARPYFTATPATLVLSL